LTKDLLIISSIGSKSFETDFSAPVSSRPISATRLSPIENKPTGSSNRTFDSNTNLDSVSVTSADNLHLSSPKTSAKSSRLAPLEINNNNNNNNNNEKTVKLKVETTRKSSAPLSTTTTGAAADGSSEVAKKDEDEAKSWTNFIEPLLNLMDGYFKDNHPDLFCDACDRLNKLLEMHQMFSKTCSKRAVILKIIFKYLDTDSDRIKIRISRIILNVTRLPHQFWLIG
jgi:hypothetical protein